MKKIILATVLAGLGSTAALAADMGARTPYTKAPAMMAIVSNWSGFYIGGNVGYGWGNNNTDFNFLPSPALFGESNDGLGTHSKGVIGGAQFGYNWQFGATVLGLETDIQGSGISGASAKLPTALLVIPGASMASSQTLSWFGTARVRLGFEIAPALLLYGTGGVAYGQPKATANFTFPDSPTVTIPFPAALSGTKAGWTAGAGVEWMFAHNWSAKVEYLYLDLGNVSVISNNPLTAGAQVKYDWKNQDHIVRAGVNYHFN
jgi:outer membrane immunogenic protein